MKTILKSLAVAASLLAGVATADTNITVRVNGTNMTFHVKTENMPLSLRQLEKEHGKRVGLEKDPVASTLTYHFADGYKYVRKLPLKWLNDTRLMPNINRKRLNELEEAGKLRRKGKLK